MHCSINVVAHKLLHLKKFDLKSCVYPDCIALHFHIPKNVTTGALATSTSMSHDSSVVYLHHLTCAVCLWLLRNCSLVHVMLPSLAYSPMIILKNSYVFFQNSTLLSIPDSSPNTPRGEWILSTKTALVVFYRLNQLHAPHRDTVSICTHPF